LEHHLPLRSEDASGGLRALDVGRHLRDLVAGALHHRLRGAVTSLARPHRRDRDHHLARGRAALPDRSGDAGHEDEMKRGLIITAVVLAVAAIVYFSVRGGGDQGEKVYADDVKARRIEAVVS